MRFIGAVIAAAALLAPAAGYAQPVSSLSGPGPDTWVEVHLGATIPQHKDLDGVDPGYAFGGTFGRASRRGSAPRARSATAARPARTRA